ncbi:MAG: M1 family metallopeptidase, partial [Candidatus Micrarchaeota archaeon]|nr:M1 family metallopeptidase [Candidatus Micrarchaeota archaeon]
KYILSTQFEAANARNAFPCFDEPAFKAVFDVTLTVDRGLDCISNMPIKNVRNIGKKKEVRFEESPIMSTYLLYLGVGNYDYVSGSSGKTKIRIITTPGRKALAKLPLEYAAKFIKYYENYFGIPYPLPKVDFLAIPDFAAGAMENWGAITFREVALLADENTSLAGKQRVAEVIAHELAHQWFGDLVTMKWWNDLWLNESFATFMASKAMDKVFPEWKVKIEYISDTIATAFGADQLKSTHPISVDVKSPTEVDQLFDEISYEKGGTVLNMIENYAGEDTFRQGLHAYLKENSYSNATKYDLWRAIDKVAKKRAKKIDVYGVAGFWIDKPGYPIVSVKRTDNKVELEQKRYFLLKNLSDNTIWPIPVNYVVSGQKKEMLFGKKRMAIGVKNEDWVKLNYGQNGLYRVSYDNEDVHRLGRLIASKELDPADAWGVEHDMYALSRSGRANVNDYLGFVDKYCFDAQYPLNSDVLGHLSGLYNMLYYYDNAKVKELCLRYSNELVDKLGWSVKKNESPHDTLMRPAALVRSAMSGHRSIVERATEMFYSYVEGKSEIDTNIRGAIYTIAAWSEGEKVVDLLKERYEKEKIPEEKIRYLRSLSMFKDKDLLLDSLEFSMSKRVRLQDSYIIPAICSSNPVGKKIILQWTEENWHKLNKIHASGTHMIGRYVDNLASIDNRSDKEEVLKFFKEKKNWRDDIRHSFDNTVELIEANIRFVDANT